MLAQNTNISELQTTTPGTPSGTQTPGTPGRRTLQVQLINALGVLGVKSSTLNNLARHGKCDLHERPSIDLRHQSRQWAISTDYIDHWSLGDQVHATIG